jgi:hypothetical protein
MVDVVGGLNGTSAVSRACTFNTINNVDLPAHIDIVQSTDRCLCNHVLVLLQSGHTIALLDLR